MLAVSEVERVGALYDHLASTISLRPVRLTQN